MVRFSLDEVEYKIIRDWKKYSLFKDKEMLWVYNSVTRELWPILAELFDFKLKLSPNWNKSSEGWLWLVTPPPAFLFLPFYIDQDKSWGLSWSGFENLKQFRWFKTNLIDYHIWIYTNEYYEMKEKLTTIKLNSSLLSEERKYAQKISDDIQEKLSSTEFNIDINEFKEDIEELLVKCNSLKIKEENLKEDLRTLFAASQHISHQISIVENAIRESSEDYKFANSLPDIVSCPTCWADYHNSFSERFSIAMDESRENDLLIELKKEYEKVQDEIRIKKEWTESLNSEIREVEIILSKQKNTIELKDVLKNYWKNHAKATFIEKLSDLDTKIWELLVLQKDIESKLRKLKDKNRIEQIKNDYKHTLSGFLDELDVPGISQAALADIHAVMEKLESWSAKPRALLAYYFTFFALMKKYGTSVYCPLIVDSPNQQAQDPDHIGTIYKFIKERQPMGTQLILGLEEFYNIEFGGEIISLNEKGSLLSTHEYNDVLIDMWFYLEQMWL